MVPVEPCVLLQPGKTVAGRRLVRRSRLTRIFPFGLGRKPISLARGQQRPTLIGVLLVTRLQLLLLAEPVAERYRVVPGDLGHGRIVRYRVAWRTPGPLLLLGGNLRTDLRLRRVAESILLGLGHVPGRLDELSELADHDLCRAHKPRLRKRDAMLGRTKNLTVKEFYLFQFFGKLSEISNCVRRHPHHEFVGWDQHEFHAE